MEEDNTNDGERFDQAMEMLDSLLDHIRNVGATVFNHEEPMDEHLTHVLFYSATRIFGEDFAKDLQLTAEKAIKMAMEHETKEIESRYEDSSGNIVGRIYH